MGNNPRTARKGKGDEPNGSKKKQLDGKDETVGAASNSASGSGESSGLRRSTRETPSKKQGDNASPASVRKSQRLENRTAPATPSGKKKPEKPSPLRRSGRDNKFQSPSSRTSEKGSTSKGGLKQQKGSKSPAPKEKNKDKAPKESAEESNGVVQQEKQNAKVTTKRKKRLSARHYRDMFKPLKKKIKVSDSSTKTRMENCDQDGGDGECESDKKGKQDNSDGELKEDCTGNVNADSGGSDSDSKRQACLGNCRESEALERLQPSLATDVPTSSPGTEAREDEFVDREADGSVREKLDSREGFLASNELSNDTNDSKCILKVTTLGAPVVGSEDAHACSEDVVPSISSPCRMISLNEQCTKCFRKRRLEYNAPKQDELCCCLSNSMDDVNLISVSKDRGEYGTFLTIPCADKHGQNIRQSELPDGERRTCCTCNSAGMLLHCIGKGCTGSYHASCLPTPEENLFLPMWYCCECTKKRLILGVHSLSEGIESIWDVREVELSNSTGVKKQKQYFVKYKGLAHIHNHWVPEVQLRHEAPELLAEFDEKKEGMHWKPEWVIPHRLLKKRLLNADASDKHNKPVAGFVSNSMCEWLVKWRGLGYDQATWEFEESSCFKAHDMERLIREYEARHERARTPLSRGNETQERRKGSHVKVGRLFGGGGFGADSCYMNSLNKLREYYHKRQNAVMLDEQDRIVKVVYLVSSIVVHISRPIVIISPCAFLSFWEAEFSRLAASINVVVYDGNRDARNIIRSVEFYEGGNIMVQVLLCSTEAVSEDLTMIKGIQWEAVIVDDCQQSCVMAHYGSIKSLVTDWRLLLVNAQLKDDVDDCINILSLLESGDNSNQDYGPTVGTSVNTDILKGRLCQFICCARFLEYWVPVQMSNLQLEQYCSLILSNRTALLSSSKSDPVGSLRDTLISTRKCCDHPYIVDPSLQASLIGGLKDPTLDAVLDLGTRASGKLTLLDEILSELRNKGLKVLILFQSVGGSGRDSKGDILDDFLRIRFGSDSYEHVDSGCLTSKKLAALNKFNKEKERSFFLLETRACLPSIKLSLVDAVIIFDSDWNPLNDLRALQKITIDSKFEQIKVFRLYCTCTVEEKVLILAKNDMILDSTLQGISPSTSHMLLMWGSSYLFSRLDEFHHDKVVDCKENIVPENSFMKHVCEEILSIIQNQETVNSVEFISAARQNGGGYLKNVALIGEQKIQLEDGIPSHLFWMRLLEGKQPQWRYLSGSSQRNRKRVHYQELGDQGDEAAKKSRKMERTKVDSSCQQPAKNMEKSNAGKKGSQEDLGIDNNMGTMASANLASHYDSGTTLPTMVNDGPGPQVNSVEPDDRKNLYNEQWDLFQTLKPAVSSICEVLHLKDDGKRLAEQFLEYVLKNHRVMAEPEAILQAFQISVCWTAAEALNYKIGHTKSFDVVRESMNFNCREEDAEAIYSKTKVFMKIFLRRSEVFKISSSSNGSVSATIGVTSRSKEHCTELGGSSVLEGLDRRVLSLMQTIDNKNDTLRYVKKFKKKCDKHLERLKEKHNCELEKFEQECEEKRAELEKKYKMESAIICSIHGKSSVGVEKLKIMDKNCAKEREDLELQISNHRKELEATQKTERDEEQKKTASWLEQVKSLVQNELLDNPPSKNGRQLQAAQLIEWELPNESASVNKDDLMKFCADLETFEMNEQNITPEVVVSEVPCFARDEQRVNHQNDASVNCLKNMPSSGEAGLNNMAENSCHADVPKMQAVPSAETVSDGCGHVGHQEQPHTAPSRGLERNNNLMEPLEIHRSTVLETNHVNEASALSTEPLPYAGSSVTKQLVANPAVEAPSMSQEIGDESCRGMADGADKQAKHVTGMLNVLSGGDPTTLVCSHPMPCNLPPTAGRGGLPVAQSSPPESVVAPPRADDQTRVAASSRTDNQSGEIHTYVGGTVARIQQEHCVNSGESVSRPFPELDVDHAVNASLGQFETHTSTTRGISPARAFRPNPQVPIFAISRSSDPLQNELERIRKEIDEVVSVHEETKLRLRSECDKEIEEIVAQIRKKYEEKLEEADVSFTLKRNELEMNQNKVMMHKILAEAFRSKCMDYRAASGMQQAISSGSLELASQMQSATTTSSTSGSFSAILPTVGPHNVAPTARAVQPSSAIASSPAAHPQIRPLAPISGLQVRSSVRVPAPFRSASVAVPTSYTPSVTCGVSVQLSPLSKSFLAPQFPPRPPSQSPAIPSPALLNSHDWSHQVGNGGSTSAPLPLSVTELFMENGMQNETNVCCLGSVSSPLPDNLQNSGSQDIAQVDTRTNLQMPSSSLGAGNNVVCLSDDE